jgi:predicted permease
MVAGISARVRSLWRGLKGRASIEAEMGEEFRLHIEMRARDLECTGQSREAALRQARAEFGRVERYKEEARAARGLRSIDVFRFSWLDFKVGFRMLARYPGLTIVGGLAMAFAIWVGAGSFELITQYIRPTLPLDGGDRIVGIQLWNGATQRVNAPTLHDYADWREQVETIGELGAFRQYERNLITDRGYGEVVRGAEVSASSFGVARVRALMGRVLLESDERANSPPVIVIGYDIWQTRFGGAADVVGRTVRLGDVHHTVVGVMPEKFAFPVSQDAWTPLRLNVLDHARGTGPRVLVFGRLSHGVRRNEAQAELTSLGLRAAADFPDTHEHLRPQVLPYARSVVPIPRGEVIGLSWLNLFVVMLVALVCGNVAMLVFARAATRESEIVVRNALGASRGRIVAQLFAEALVLGSLGAIIGLVGAGYGLRWGLFVLEGNLGRLPFWFDDTLSRRTLLYAGGLTLLGALIAGVLPALRVTRSVGTRLRQTSAGAGGLRFSGIWTVVIVAQVAVTVAFPAAAFFVHRAREPIVSFDVGFRSEQFLSVQLAFEGDSDRIARVRQELERQLSAEPAVAGVTFADRLPRMYHGERRIDVAEGVPVPPDSVTGRSVHIASVDIDYFDVLGAEILAGRGFNTGDVESGSRIVIVNQSFVERALQRRNPIGRRVRFLESREGGEAPAEPGPWYEIVGVVRDLGMNYLGRTSGMGGAGLYHPSALHTSGHYMVVRVRGDPAAYAPRLQEIATAVDPTLRLSDLMPMDLMDAGVLKMIAIYIGVVLLVSAVAMLLSLAGIYAVMSFAVSRRTREIGIRVALGAGARSVMLAVFRRPLMQVGSGVIIGGWLVAQLTRNVTGGLTAHEIWLVVAYATLMLAVCLLACIVPARRALAIEPNDALRDHG